MKVELNESDWQTNISLTPENMAEVSKLFRMVKHSKREVPEMYLSFSEFNTDGTPRLSIYFVKKQSTNIVSSINNK